tara:strand:- start:61 stop:351 length:291 start_codon:yes stop_codon:yes gene_type:complete
LKNLEEYIEKAMKNIDEDRAAAKTLLTELMLYIRQADDRQKEVGMIAAKYLETLQRSNEQLVKVSAIVQRDRKPQDGISDKDKQDLFDLIQNEEEG